MTDENRLRPFWRPVLGAIALLCVAFVVFKAARAPSSQEALLGSLKELGLPELTTAFVLHPDTCSIERSFWKWHVSCEGVPISFYQDRMLCNAGPPRTCTTVPSEERVCVSYYWDIDLNGVPSNPRGDHGRYASVGDGCNPKGSRVAEREAMAKLGITPHRVE
ncbi:hypothetical protein [Bradyrhizobium sp. LTSP857]|uniref:hypothetical protein n=1 Tax=Bradyrhizobium sp. LTSP857 TaxID=1619231 RepID=UPI0012E034F6|nr:hypothetical protein [Bradyrhizobium sp. LTSP857]